MCAWRGSAASKTVATVLVTAYLAVMVGYALSPRAAVPAVAAVAAATVAGIAVTKASSNSAASPKSPRHWGRNYLPFFKETRTGIPVVKNRPWIELTSVQR